MKKSSSQKNHIENAKTLLKWLYPGIGIKRWILLACSGVFFVIVGSSRFNTDSFWYVKALDVVVIVSGFMILILAIRRLFLSLITAFVPQEKNGDLVEMLYQRRQRNKGPKIVVIGGGTGLSVLLTGLKQYSSNITAIVTVADDGGSSGRLRKEFDILPPGDIRNCLIALSDAPTLMRDLFQFRFDTNSELSGHSFGNLFITAMTRVTGDFEKAIKETSNVLALRGKVVPSTLESVVLVAQHKDGTLTEGEDKIPKARKAIKKVLLKPESPAATPDAIRAIQEAQVIILGPGSLYTSIIPNLLIKEITDSIVASEAIKIYVCNVMTQPGETDRFNASDHIKILVSHSHPRVFDYCIVNTSHISVDVIHRYAEEQSHPVVNDAKAIKNMGYRVVEEDICFVDSVVRHDPARLAKIIVDFMEEI
jgi:uncharacterized cofD-like protein